MNIIIIFIILINFSYSSNTEDKLESEVISLILLGEYEILSKNYDKASKYYLEALRYDHKSITINLSLFDLYLTMNDLKNSSKYIYNAFILDTTDLDIGIKTANIYLLNNQIDRYQHILEILYNQYPDNVEIINYLYNQYKITRQWDKLVNFLINIYIIDSSKTEYLKEVYNIAINTNNEEKIYKKLESIFHLDNNNILIISYLKDISYRLQLYEKTKNYLKLLIKLTENNYNYKLQLVEVYFFLKKYNEALIILDDISVLNKEMKIFNYYSIILTELENYNRLKKICYQYIEYYKDVPEIYKNLLITCFRLKEYSIAKKIAIISKQKFKEKIIFPYILGETFFILGEYKQAKDEYLYALKLSPNNRLIHNSLISVCEELNEFNYSDSLFNILIKEDKNDAITLNNYAYNLSQRLIINTSTLHYALQLVKKALIIEPDNSSYLDTFGWLYYKLKDYKNALKYIKQSYELDNNNSEIIEHLGDIYYKLNDIETAVKYYSKLISGLRENYRIKTIIEEYERKN